MAENPELKRYLEGQPERFEAVVDTRWKKAGAERRSDILPRRTGKSNSRTPDQVRRGRSR